jgi:hypothetical protein
MFQRDYILRAIEAASEALARALRLFLVDKKPEQAEEEVAAGYAALGLDRELLLLLDGPTLRRHMGDDDKLLMAVRLLLSESEIKCHKGEKAAASRRLKAARRLLTEHPAVPAELTAELARVTHVLETAG